MDYEDGSNVAMDTFFNEGQRIVEEEAANKEAWRAAMEEQMGVEEVEREADRDLALLQGRLKREELKQVLFQFLDGE